MKGFMVLTSSLESHEGDALKALLPVGNWARLCCSRQGQRKAFARGRASGRPIKVIYHSHCDAGAYFSPEDAATFASGGTLMWPCAFLVVSVVEGVAAGHRLWVHTPGTDAFHEAVLEICNPDDTRSDHAPR